MNLKITDTRAAELYELLDSRAEPHVADLLSDRAAYIALLKEMRLKLAMSEIAARIAEEDRRESLDRATRAERQLQAAEKVVEAVIAWENGGVLDSDGLEGALCRARIAYTQARQSPETAPGSDLPGGAATHVAGEAK